MPRDRLSGLIYRARVVLGKSMYRLLGVYLTVANYKLVGSLVIFIKYTIH